MLTSPLLRAVQTANALNASLHLPLQEAPLLQERDWGELTGHPVAEVRALKEMPGSVETVGAMFLRARAFLKQVLAECDGKCVLAVTHGLFARCLQAAFYGVTIREIPPMETPRHACWRLRQAPSDWGRVEHRPTWSPTNNAPSPRCRSCALRASRRQLLEGGAGSIFNHIGSIYNRLGIDSDHWCVMLRK